MLARHYHVQQWNVQLLKAQVLFYILTLSHSEEKSDLLMQSIPSSLQITVKLLSIPD